jgi:serine/threonine protein kinase/Tfp pilus assembly protein PilF
MSAPALIPEQRTCRRCQTAINPKRSYHGYCLPCLLNPALESDNPFEADQAHRFEPYEILTHADGSFVELGRGSMGITYSALDTNLQLPVALKVIDFKAAGQEINWERFLREARAAARLRHPHVVNVLYYGVARDGQCYYAMELVEGETLAERVRHSGPLPVADALEIVAQVASALVAAEKQGLVHRDLKPANLMLLNGLGINAKVIDFGLAKIVGDQEPSDRITQDGFIGTPAFASPEQFSPEKIDQRSDYFSLGSTLFYLLTGNPPFKADHMPDLAEQMIHREPLIAELKAARIPLPVRQLVNSLLSAAPEGRPQNGQALLEAITQCQEAVERTESKPIGRVIGWTAAILLSLLIGAAIFLFQSGVFTQDNNAKSIAVLPFDNQSPVKDDSYFAEGVQDDILTNLAKIADLQVISRGSVQAYRNPANRPLPREIGQALRVRYLLNGSIQREGNRIRVTAQLEEAQTGHELWAERYDGELTDVFSIQAELAEGISQELRAKLSTAEKSSIGEIPTRDLDAYELYLHAKELMADYDEDTQSADPLQSAARLLQDAVNRDPNFALAWATLARAHDCLYWYNLDHTESRRTAAEDALQKALQLRPDLGEVHLEAGFHLLVTTRDYPAIRRELEIALSTLPNSAYLFGLLASIDSRQGQWLEAIEDYERASKLDPKNVSLMIDLYGIYEFHRQYRDVHRALEETARVGANAQSIEFKKAVLAWQEKGDTSAFHAILDEPNGPLRAIGRATLVKLNSAVADRNFARAEQILAADPKQEFEGGQRKFACRDFVLGWLKRSEGDNAAAEVAFENARPLQLAYVQKWPDDPNPLIMLAFNDAALGRKEDALKEGRQATAMQPISRDALDGPLLAEDLAQIYLWAGEPELAMNQLESLVQVPRALTYGDLAKLPDWDGLRDDPRFQKLLSELKPIPIVNRATRLKLVADDKLQNDK